MIDKEVYRLLKCFQGSYINQCGECILKEKGNVYFTIRHCESRHDIILKLLEWCSRPMAKGEPYRQDKRNDEWRNELIKGINEYLGTSFNKEDMYWIYDTLGNEVNRELAERFVKSGYNMKLLKKN